MNRAAFAMLCLSGSLLAAAFGATAAADPLDPKFHERAADMGYARAATLRQSDLGDGWTPIRIPANLPAGVSDDCPGYKLDYSDLTVTGAHARGFVKQTVTAMGQVNVWATADDARRAFTLDLRPAAVRCFARLIGATFEAFSQIPAKLLSVEPYRARTLAERSGAFRLTHEITIGSSSFRLYTDCLEFGRARALAVVCSASVGQRASDPRAFATRVADRLR